MLRRRTGCAHRVSAKLFNCTPANLPLDMKQNLIHLLGRGINSMEGYIRPGCVHVTLNAVTDVQRVGDSEVLLPVLVAGS